MPYNWDKPIEIREGRSRMWFWIEKELWNDPTLTASDKVIYGSLAYFANNKTQEAYPSLTTLAKFSQCSKMQVSRSLKALEQLGVLLIHRRAGKHNSYTLLKYPSNKLLLVTNKNVTSNNYDLTSNKSGQVLVTNTDTNNNYINNNKEQELLNNKKEIYKEKRYLDNKDFHEQLRDMFPNVSLEEELEKMKDWLSANGVRKKDYAAFARNWLRNAKPKERETIAVIRP